jgi:hypothetical protein
VSLFSLWGLTEVGNSEDAINVESAQTLHPKFYWSRYAMLTRSLSFSLALVVLSLSGHAQNASGGSLQQNTSTGAPSTTSSNPDSGPIQLTAAQDHQRLVEQLQLKELRPGSKPNGTGTTAPNYDEDKANPWPNLPNPLILNNGKRVTTAKMWWTKRRPELVEIFDREYIGRVPANVPGVRWEVGAATAGTEGDVATLTRHLTGHVDNSGYPAITVNIEADLTLPANASGPVPVVIEFTFEPYPRTSETAASPITTLILNAGPVWKRQVLAKGWGYALLYPKSFQADGGAGLTQGIIGLANHGQPRKLDDWGALRAWAWGGSRLMDYFETDKAVDARHVAIEGHSRFGKTALVAMAYDQRFAVAYVSSAGAGGSALARRRFGEELENIAGTGEYHWMAGNYLKYAGTLTPADLPIDTHELIALCAPRPVFIGGGTTKGDGWADTHGSFLAEVGAGAVYELLGKRGLGTSTYPPIETALISGDLGFRQHSEGHTALPNWPTFITFASRYMTPSVPTAKGSH